MWLTNPNKLLYFDIETVPEKEQFSQLNSKKKEIFIEKYFKKKGKSKGYEKPSEYYQDTAGLIAEFWKIVAISM